ncbi:MAG: adenosylcobinamide-GDP ribazoletransferase [Oscillospiraceae bacterium]|nr:adenosylcobinamide-GDP ribazoletransferase [Oscillospiraceae bacterium]
MKKLVTGFFMSWGMFCAIPCPCKLWDEEARPLMLVCFPVLGLLLGGLWALLAFVLSKFALGLFAAALMAVLPFLLTGFIHLDGFMDCCDAILSRRDLEERQRIMKDSHTGAFAVICVVILMLVQTSAFSLFGFGGKILPLIFIPATTRACAACAVMCLRPIGHSSYAGAFDKRVKPAHKIAAAVMLAFSVAAPIVLFGLNGLSAACAGVGYGLAVWYGYRQLGGMSGDISGYALTIAEAVGAVALCLL